MSDKNQNGPAPFSPENRAHIFGQEAAEKEDKIRFREYFFKNRAFESVSSDLPLRILVGQKGIGKSALLRMCALEDETNGVITIKLTPDDTFDKIATTNSKIAMTKAWKENLTDLIFHKVIETLAAPSEHETTRSFQYKKFGSDAASAVMGFFKHTKSDFFDAAKLPIIKNFIEREKIRIYIDDLDRDWTGDQLGVDRISALLIAISDLTIESRTLQFRIGLRSDIFYRVSTQEDTIDKIETSIVRLTWTNHEILTVLAGRIQTYLGHDIDLKRTGELRQHQIAGYLDAFFEDRFKGEGVWSNIPMYRALLSFVRARPRDLILLCHAAAERADLDGAHRISSDHIRAILPEYSRKRLNDIVVEFRSELSNVRELLEEMRPFKKEKTTLQSYSYTTDQLISKLNNIVSRKNFIFSYGKAATSQDLLRFLFRVNFITARKRDAENYIVRKYFEEGEAIYNQIQVGGWEWEVHPAYRWALQPESPDGMFTLLVPTSDNDE